MNEETQTTTTELVPQDEQSTGVVEGTVVLPVVGEARQSTPVGGPNPEGEESPF